MNKSREPYLFLWQNTLDINEGHFHRILKLSPTDSKEKKESWPVTEEWPKSDDNGSDAALLTLSCLCSMSFRKDGCFNNTFPPALSTMAFMVERLGQMPGVM
jgi:hypothetical protein